MGEKYSVVVTAIIRKDNKYLIAKRSLEEEKFPGYWTVPGGTMDVDDHTAPNAQGIMYAALEEALKREVLEEVNVQITNIRYLISMVYQKKSGFALCISFFADYLDGEVTCLNEEEIIDFAWVRADELKDYQLIKGIPEEILMVDDIVQGREVKRWEEYEQLV